VRALLDAGTRPESIGVVARDLAGVQLALRQHLERLAIPYSTLGAPGLRGPASRRVDAVAALLAEGGGAAADAWLDAAYGAGGAAIGDLRLALRVLGAATVAEIAALPLAERLAGAASLPLPVRRGFEAADGGDDGTPDDGGADDSDAPDVDEERAVYAARRHVSAARLDRAVAAAGRWCRAWTALPARAAMPAYAVALGRLLAGEVRSQHAGDGHPVREALARLAAELPSDLVLEREEALDLVREELRRAGRVQPGGAGAGVQVMGVVEARARTFAHLFVLGLNRDVFPRQVREDWLLPDRLRAALLPVLPDVPLKRTGHDEERFLFAELLSAAPAVGVSWTECDDDGKPTAASPLAERLCDGDHSRVPLLPDLWAAGGDTRPAHEHAVLAGLYGSRERFAAVLPVALGDDGGGEGVATLAGVRMAVLAELDPDRRTADGRARAASPGPYFGFTGTALPGGGDPRGGEVWVTALEAAARCPWQMFLARLLRLEPVPDAGAELPAFSGAVLGSAVHGALERVARGDAGESPRTVEEAAAAPARPVTWPADEALELVLAAAAEAALRDEGLALPLLVRGLTERARPFVDAARRADFAAPAAAAGAEVVGSAAVTDAAGRTRRIAFRADRADATAGGLVLTDYKTGGGLTPSAQEKYKRRALLKGIARGQVLQAAAYAAAGGGVSAGRYLFLKPEMEDGAREVVAAADGEVMSAFGAAVGDLLALVDAGAFFPRLATADGRNEGPGCGACAFREACLIGDSGARRRLLAWTAAAGRDVASGPMVRAAERVWRLGLDDGEGEGRR
jgi:RecB family exonuclease